MTALLRPHHTDCPCLICQEPAACCCDPCDSVLAGEEPDMALGDICMLCLRRECERCGESIDLDEENQIRPPPIHVKGSAVPIPKQEGYLDVCDGCLKDTDVLYDEELEAERRA